MSTTEEFRARLRAGLTGEFAAPRGPGGPGRKHEVSLERRAWERHMAAAVWTCAGLPAEARP
ncbi:hypothetical protein ACFUKV_14150 [Streptomyces paradoxus]|uniref:hypothetical protein n=1 Tax=Streptomyces paradoxus TaxID=66375 RepID=UPI0036336A1D